ncbi:MAG: hypothetical protein A3K19_07980 [Lentisphaerae bacterium RIFOXYB12_FULL_65_16]|nr:MAG: hypothetical protein A3K18_08850 [Lentisphaerae bacterium RIFOXYA12_64_32]OGV87586.1 MAG: hypothetical protein A3K19_07980 [Lentisphaerae bacterium RIFOXYB12_FULL_65_16]
MQTSGTSQNYSLIDSGRGRKLERFGPYLIDRPCACAIWAPKRAAEWPKADAVFSREGGSHWDFRRDLPEAWQMEFGGLKFRVGPTAFGHMGAFPEHAHCWAWMQERLRSWQARAGRRDAQVLNLFAYSGGATLAVAQTGAAVCHLDASPKIVERAKENARLNGLEQAPIRYIVDDVRKFLGRERRRERRYEGIILDPPSFGRGSKQEVFKIEDDLPGLLEQCRDILAPEPLFLLVTCHTPGLTPLGLGNLLDQAMAGFTGAIDAGELALPPDDAQTRPVPSGAFAGWTGRHDAGSP